MFAVVSAEARALAEFSLVAFLDSEEGVLARVELASEVVAVIAYGGLILRVDFGVQVLGGVGAVVDVADGSDPLFVGPA